MVRFSCKMIFNLIQWAHFSALIALINARGFTRSHSIVVDLVAISVVRLKPLV